jgi:hypothetical protein
MDTTIAICIILMNISIAIAAAGFEYFSYSNEMLEQARIYENNDKVLSSFFNAIIGDSDDMDHVSKLNNIRFIIFYLFYFQVLDEIIQ